MNDMTVYSDLYFLNTVNIVDAAFNDDPIVVEAQVFTRSRRPVIVAGITEAIAALKTFCSKDTFNRLEIEAVSDGTIVVYEGDPCTVLPVMKIRGVYKDFSAAETVILGILAHMTRVATNVYEVLVVAQETPITFYPARFDIPEAQHYDGAAYSIAVDAYNRNYSNLIDTDQQKSVSTLSQALAFGGKPSGTSPHSLIACFRGNNVLAMHYYAETLPVEQKRVALVDFNNDCAADSINVASYYFERYLYALKTDDAVEAERWTLYGVRLDTSGSHVDQGLLNAGIVTDEPANRGVTPELVWHVRGSLNAYPYETYRDTPDFETAVEYFSKIKIIVTGGFNASKIHSFVSRNIPVDMFGVGSSLLRNDSDSNADFTMDVVRIKENNAWVDVAKVGRAASNNPDLKTVKHNPL